MPDPSPLPPSPARAVRSVEIPGYLFMGCFDRVVQVRGFVGAKVLGLWRRSEGHPARVWLVFDAPAEPVGCAVEVIAVPLSDGFSLRPGFTFAGIVDEPFGYAVFYRLPL